MHLYAPAPSLPSDPLVFGFWKVGKDVCANVAYEAIKSGYRRLDCACDYGNEVEVGKGIARAIQGEWPIAYYSSRDCTDLLLCRLHVYCGRDSYVRNYFYF